LQIGDRRIGSPKTTSSQAQVAVGGGLQGYVMKKRIDWHEEDQAAKQEYVNKTEAATKQEALDGNYGKLDLNAPR
jgi:ribosomal protein S1